MCLACFLCVRVSEFTSHIFVQPFYLFIFILWLWKHARSLLRSMFSVGVCVCVLCARSWWFVFVLLATRGPSWHSDSSSQSDSGALPSNNRGFVALLLLACYGLPSFSLSVAFSPFFIEPIFLSEVLIWGAGQWGEGREGNRGREEQGEKEREREERKCRVVIAADGRPFVPSFPGSSLEPPRLQLRSSLPGRERKRGRLGGKRGHNELPNWNLPIAQTNLHTWRKNESRRIEEISEWRINRSAQIGTRWDMLKKNQWV